MPAFPKPTATETDPVAGPNLTTHTALTTTAHGGIVASDDARLTNARTPTAHKTTHATGQSDAIAPSDIGAATAAAAAAAQSTADGAVVLADSTTLTATETTSLTNQGNGPGWMATQGNVLFVEVANDAKVKSYDITDPSAPVYLGQVTVGSSTAYIGVKGRYLFVTDQGDVKLRVVDCTDPTAMSVVSTTTYSAGGAANGGGGGRFDIDQLGTTMLIGGPENGTNANVPVLVDISTPTSPAVLGTVAAFGGTHRGVASLGNGFWAVSDRDNKKVHVVDATTPTAPVVVSSVTCQGTTTTPLACQGNVLFVGAYGGGYLEAYDVSVPSATPVYLGKVSIGGVGAECIVVRGGLAYVSLRLLHQLVIVDVRNPAKMVVLSTTTFTGTVTTGVAVSAGGYAYVTSLGDTANGIIYVVSVKAGARQRISALEEILARLTLYGNSRLGARPSTKEKEALAGTSGTPSSSNKYVTSAETSRYDGTDGQTGFLAAPSQGSTGWSVTRAALVANRGYILRFVPKRNYTITKAAFAVSNLDGSDNGYEILVWDSVVDGSNNLTTILARTGEQKDAGGQSLHTTTGVKTPALSVSLTAGHVYYVEFVSASTATVAMLEFSLASLFGRPYGVNAPQVCMGDMASTYSAGHNGSTFTPSIDGNVCPAVWLRES